MSLTSVFWGPILISDEPDDQERRQFQYLAQEKLSYIRKYLEQTRDTDVYSLSTEDDSGKPGSNSAPSEFGFEETSTGMTLCPLGHLSSSAFPLGICHQVASQRSFIGINKPVSKFKSKHLTMS